MRFLAGFLHHSLRASAVITTLIAQGLFLPVSEENFLEFNRSKIAKVRGVERIVFTPGLAIIKMSVGMESPLIVVSD